MTERLRNAAPDDGVRGPAAHGLQYKVFERFVAAGNIDQEAVDQMRS